MFPTRVPPYLPTHAPPTPTAQVAFTGCNLPAPFTTKPPQLEALQAQQATSLQALQLSTEEEELLQEAEAFDQQRPGRAAAKEQQLRAAKAKVAARAQLYPQLQENLQFCWTEVSGLQQALAALAPSPFYPQSSPSTVALCPVSASALRPQLIRSVPLDPAPSPCPVPVPWHGGRHPVE